MECAMKLSLKNSEYDQERQIKQSNQLSLPHQDQGH